MPSLLYEYTTLNKTIWNYPLKIHDQKCKLKWSEIFCLYNPASMMVLGNVLLNYNYAAHTMGHRIIQTNTHKAEWWKIDCKGF